MSKKGLCCGPVHVKPFAFECHRLQTKVAACVRAATMQAGQYCFVCVPSVSRWEWHPLSIVSAPGTSPGVTLSFACKVPGEGGCTAICTLSSPLSVRPVCSPPPSPSPHSFVLPLLASVVPCDCRASTLLACTAQSAPCTLCRFVLCASVGLPSLAPPTFSLTKN
jgi:hypothetical protein